jgi:hypothetical protein
MNSLQAEWNQFLEKIKDQEWYQQIQSQFQQLPPDQQQMVKWGSVALSGLLGLWMAFSFSSSAGEAKADYYEKQDLLQVINQAGDELKRMKGQNTNIGQSPNKDWKPFFTTVASNVGLAPENIEVLKESPGPLKGIIQETLLEISIKGIAIRPLVQMIYQMEHGPTPIKLRYLQITAPYGSSALSARLAMSGFGAKEDTTKSERK